MKKGTISVLMPVYNRERMVAAAIRCILLQTYENIQLIVYDDGSKDSTTETVNNFMMTDNRIRLIKAEKNDGVAHARNQLLKATETKIACWMDSDDLSNINRITLQYEFMKKNECSLVFSNYMILRNHEFDAMYKSGRWKNPPFVGDGSKRGFATAMFHVDHVGTFDRNKRLGGEDLTWLNAIENKHKACMMKWMLYYIRFHDDRIGMWKRKLSYLSGYSGVDNSEITQKATYEEMITRYKKETH